MHTAKAARRTAKAYGEDSNEDKAAASAARHVYAASGTTNNPKATTFAARRACMARAAVRTAKANGINDGARNKGSGDNEAKVSAIRRAYT